MKKGSIETPSEWIIHLAFLLLVIIILFSAIYRIQGSKLHNLRVEARDYAFTLDTLSSSPYDLHYNYALKENVVINFNEKTCLVQAKFREETTQGISFFCGLDKFTSIKQQQAGSSIIITK